MSLAGNAGTFQSFMQKLLGPFAKRTNADFFEDVQAFVEAAKKEGPHTPNGRLYLGAALECIAVGPLRRLRWPWLGVEEALKWTTSAVIIGRLAELSPSLKQCAAAALADLVYFLPSGNGSRRMSMREKVVKKIIPAFLGHDSMPSLCGSLNLLRATIGEEQGGAPRLLFFPSDYLGTLAKRVCVLSTRENLLDQKARQPVLAP
jgi:hypothetical protein